MSTPGGRLVLSLLDKESKYKDLDSQLQESEKDRAARLDQIHQYDTWLKETQTRVTELHNANNELHDELAKFKSSFAYKVGKRLGIIS